MMQNVGCSVIYINNLHAEKCHNTFMPHLRTLFAFYTVASCVENLPVQVSDSTTFPSIFPFTFVINFLIKFWHILKKHRHNKELADAIILYY